MRIWNKSLIFQHSERSADHNRLHWFNAAMQEVVMSFSAKGAHKMVIEITSADIISLLNQISDMNVELFSLQYINDISVRLQIPNKSFQKISAISKKTGSSLRCIHISGFSLLKSKYFILHSCLKLQLLNYSPNV